ncbi:MAG TPA: TraB/GumN family protein [Steroidobacteraceae bacterium]|nr:TraB/GumN family protein [Steroidobacteraceae bacterium]
MRALPPPAFSRTLALSLRIFAPAPRIFQPVLRIFALAFVLCAFTLPARADTPLHSLWELHGKHNTVYLLGSIHVLRPGDYPLAPAVLQAYANVKSLVMEINLGDMDSAEMQSEMLTSATLPEGKTLPDILGSRRYSRATSLAHEVGIELAMFDQFAPWFAAEAISQVQLMQLGFQPQSGVEMYFLERARSDGKSIAGLETVHDQIALFEGLSMDAQADYLVSSLEQAHELPTQVDDMVRAWQRGDTAWFESQLTSELGRDPALYQSVLAARNRKWIPKIEALLNDDKSYLVIVGTGHLVGRNSVIDLLKKDGIGATQR